MSLTTVGPMAQALVVRNYDLRWEDSMALEETSVSSVADPQVGKKYFSVAEANRALPYITRVIDDVISVYDNIVTLRRKLERYPDTIESIDAERDYERSMDRLSSLVDELNDVGVELKDFEKGLVDFPALYDDREVLLCWRKGEHQVDHWHEVDAGVAGRHPVDTLDS